MLRHEPLGLTVVKRLLLALVPVFAVGVYFDSFNNTIIGAATLLVVTTLVLAYLIDTGISWTTARTGLILIILLYLLSGIVPAFSTGGKPRLILRDSVRYSINLLAMGFGATEAIARGWRTYARTAIGLLAILAVLGLFASLFGSLSIFGLTSERIYSLEIGTISWHATKSLLWNPNYYGVSLAIGLAYLLGSQPSLFHSLRWPLIILLSVAILLSGSRSATAILFSLLIIYTTVILAKLGSLRYALLVPTVSIVILILSLDIGDFSQLSSYVGEIHQFFVGQGLNERGTRLAAARTVIETNPTGVGFGAVVDIVGRFTRGGSVQNSLLMYYVIGGPAMLAAIIIATSTACYQYLVDIVTLPIKQLRGPVFAMSLSLLVVILDGLFRTYSLGGIGWIPLNLTLGITLGILRTKRSSARLT